MDLVEFLSNLANHIGNSLTAYAYDENEDLSAEDKKQKLINDKQMNALHDVQEALFVDNDGNSLALTKASISISINPMSPDQYYSVAIMDYHVIGFSGYDIDSIFDTMYEIETYA